MANLPKIYILLSACPAGPGGQDVLGHALAEDGHCLASHWSSTEAFGCHDMGLTSDWKHDNYKEHYPDGYELVQVENDKDAGWLPAFEKNQALKKAAEERGEPND